VVDSKTRDRGIYYIFSAETLQYMTKKGVKLDELAQECGLKSIDVTHKDVGIEDNRCLLKFHRNVNECDVIEKLPGKRVAIVFGDYAKRALEEVIRRRSVDYLVIINESFYGLNKDAQYVTDTYFGYLRGIGNMCSSKKGQYERIQRFTKETLNILNSVEMVLEDRECLNKMNLDNQCYIFTLLLKGVNIIDLQNIS